jgi:hypothetical protein
MVNKHNFITLSKQKYGDLYLYDSTIFISKYKKVKIFCREHGIFEQTPYQFLKGCTCLQCSYKSRGLLNRTNKFLKKLEELHTDYDYSNVDYINSNTKICIICREHGEFKQLPQDHLNGAHCPKCAGINKSHNYFIKTGFNYPMQDPNTVSKRTQNYIIKHGAKQGCLHNPTAFSKLEDKDWLYNEYIICKKSSPQISFELKVNEVTVRNYLRKFKILINKKGNFSGISIHWLNFISVNQDIFIQHAQNLGEYQLPGTKLIVDGFCENTNTCYEFHGDIWHGNPKLYQPHEKCNPFSKLTAGELYQRTMERDATIKNLGYNLEVMWESDYNIISKLIT